MKLEIESIRSIDIPSASGVVYFKGKLFVISDDAPFVFEVSLEDYTYTKMPLVLGNANIQRIRKSIKPDLECAAMLEWKGKNYLLAFGSGAKSPQRDSLMLINLQEFSETQMISLTQFYHHLREQTATPPGQWNLEGAAIQRDSLLLLNRGTNTVIVLEVNQFMNYVTAGGNLPSLRHFKIDLPPMDNFIPRFSGACALNDDIIFCASIEDTPDWIADGNIIGSAIGIFNMQAGQLKSFEFLKDKEGNILKEKIESVEVIYKEKNKIRIMAVSDNDDGTSKIISIRIIQ